MTPLARERAGVAAGMVGGLARGAAARALEFVLTFYPSAGLLLMLLPRLF